MRCGQLPICARSGDPLDASHSHVPETMDQNRDPSISSYLVAERLGHRGGSAIRWNAWACGSFIVPWKERINGCPCIFKPLPSLAFGAGNDDAEGATMKAGDAAQAEDAGSPDSLKGISKGALLSFRHGV